jgi:hypothetical protein
LALLFGGCYGDFGRPRPSIFGDNRAWWMGVDASQALGTFPSVFPLTEYEVLMRDLAYNLINPPYDRSRWNLALAEFLRTGVPPFGQAAARTFYPPWLVPGGYVPAATRYARLIDEIRNDVERFDGFLLPAAKVLDLDRKREQSLAYVSGLTAGEVANARQRIAENAVIVEWVRRCLTDRAATYRFGLERLVISMPAPMAAEAERALVELESRLTVPGVSPAGVAVVTK